MYGHQTRIRAVLYWKLLVAAGPLLLTGCAVGSATGQTTLADQIQTFIVDFAREALAAYLL
jgi:hypothetical protein